MADFSHLEIRYGERGYVGKVNEFITAVENTETMKEDFEQGTVTVGNGLVQTGGSYTGNVVITMGTPGTVTGATSNSVTANSHTHNLPVASVAQAQDGVLNSVATTPLRTSQHVTARVATNADMENGVSDKLVTIDGLSHYRQHVTVNGMEISDSLLATPLFTRQYYLSRVTDETYSGSRILTPAVLGKKIGRVVSVGIGKGVGDVTQYLTNRWGTVTIPTIGSQSGDMAENPTNGRMVIVGRSGARVLTSGDGVTWDNVPSMTGSYKCVIWSERLGLFLTLSGTGTQRVSTSTNGISWVDRTTPQYDWNWMAESPQLGLIVAVAQATAGGRVMVSEDGVNWEVHQTSTTAQLTGITWSPELGIFVAVGYNTIVISEDGKNWSTVTSPNIPWARVTWSGSLGIFVAGSFLGSTSFATSSDGVSWQTLSVNKDASGWFGLEWSDELGLFLANASQGDDSGLYVSKDGHRWNHKKSTTTTGVTAAMYSTYYGRFYATTGSTELSYAPI